MMFSSPVYVSAKVYEGLEAVRCSGRTNMLDLSAVVRIAIEMDFVDTAMWVRSHQVNYSRGILFGFIAMERRKW